MRRIKSISILLVLGLILSNCANKYEYSFQDPSRSVDKRVDDLVSRLTLEEKISQMTDVAAPVERLGIPGYNWWNECLHGVARAGTATVFPQAIGLAATWDTDLTYQMADVTSTEARAKYHEFVRNKDWSRYHGLTFWSPNINIFRDPRWGRGQETYGEDPVLTSKIGVAFVKGLQGDHPKYLKVVATPKHYAVHSGPEPNRHIFDAVTDKRVLWDTYLPAFEATITEGKAYSIMGAYNRYLGEACCAHDLLLGEILREKWGFEGYVVSDCGAIRDIYAYHKLVETPEEASALAVKKGCDLNCGRTYESLLKAVEQGLITEEEIDVTIKRLFRARFKLGMFDPPEMVPYTQIPFEKNDAPEHADLALTVAQESMTLLKNDNNFLPLISKLKQIAVIGPNADNLDVLLGNYNGTPSYPATALSGIKNGVGEGTIVKYAPGCGLVGKDMVMDTIPGYDAFAEAVILAKSSDVVIFCGGISPRLEGEEMQVPFEGFSGGDRTNIKLPAVQEKLIKSLHATGTPVVLVNFSGSAIALNWENENLPAIIQAWYPGQAGGTAIADVIFGNYNPGGRLPVTFYKSVEDLPPFDDYSMKNHTYRYFDGEPLYPFGYGLSYTTFEYGTPELSDNSIKKSGSVEVTVEVKNTGDIGGSEVVQLYVKDIESKYPVAKKALREFKRIYLEAGESQIVNFTLEPKDFRVIDDDGNRFVEPGVFDILVGGNSVELKKTILTVDK
ncbi:MAG: glycoside hydrolase family 3 C-terminal domain-containing protein [Bacteroidetes bacterium]|nr:glycoside hydrolase family 3 C-terminal domain-containing protein [Bacteroidota bacterium]